MGNCGSSSAIERAEAAANKRIDAELKQTQKTLAREVKLLLLGAGESGKSTIAKQMRIIYLSGFTDDEKKHYKEINKNNRVLTPLQIIYSNMVTSMRALITGAMKLGIKVEESNRDVARNIIESSGPNAISPEIVDNFKIMWADKGIKEAFSKSSFFQLYDSTEYYFNDIDRIAASDFVPNEQDILRCRAKTTGITETEFDVEGVHFRMVDVGGQRSERKKWIHCFQDVTTVLFCVAMSEYDLKLYEDETVNRMDESLKLFDEICNSKWFSDTSIILFLNKSDIFLEKIKTVDLNVCFKNYKGGCNYDRAVAYMQKQFVKLNHNQKRKEIYCHTTCATDTGNIKYVFSVVKDIVIKKILMKSGLVM